MACSKPVFKIFIPGSHPNQANLEFLQSIFVEYQIPGKIISLEKKEIPGITFVQVILTVSFDDSPKSDFQEKIRSPFGLKVFFELEDGSEKHLILKEFRESPPQKRQPPPLVKDDEAFPPISSKSGDAPPQLIPQQFNPQFQRQLDALQRVHQNCWADLKARHQMEICRMSEQIERDIKEFRDFQEWKMQTSQSSSSSITVVHPSSLTSKLSEELNKPRQESRSKTSYAEAAAAQGETSKEEETAEKKSSSSKTLNFAEPPTTSHFE